VIKCFVFTVLTVAVVVVAGCASKKIVVKNCEVTERSDIYVCESL